MSLQMIGYGLGILLKYAFTTTWPGCAATIHTHPFGMATPLTKVGTHEKPDYRYHRCIIIVCDFLRWSVPGLWF